MSKVADIVKKKGSAVMSIGPGARAIDAALLMNEHKIGALVVLEDDRIVGIVSERDMMRRVVAARLNPDEVVIRDVMTTSVVTCRLETPLDEARRLFQSRRIRHLPVVDDGDRVEGVISIGDLNAWQLDGQAVEIKHLHDYLYGAA